MTVIACVETVALVVAVFLVFRLNADYVEERRELLNRIQHPEIVPVKPAANYVVPEQEPDGWNEIGAIEFDPAYGTD